MKKNNDEGRIWNIIPEFFFDLISRVPPGILIIFLSNKFIFETLYDYKIIDLGFSEIFIIILFGYAMGIFISTPAKLIGNIYFKSVWVNKYKSEKKLLDEYLNDYKIDNIEIQNYKKLKTDDWMLIYRNTHDFVKNSNNQAEVMLPKLSAECALANNTAASLIFFLIILSIKHFVFSTIDNFYWFSPLILICIGLIFVGKERFKRLLGSQFSYLKIIYKEKEKT